MAQVAVVVNVPNRVAAALPNFITQGEEFARFVRLDSGDASAALENVAVSDLKIVPITAEADTFTAPAIPSDKTSKRKVTTKRVLIAGGAAGNLTVTGIKTTHTLIAVLKIVDANQAFTDLTSEFTITALNTINNTGGTTTASSHVAVVYA